MAFKLQVLNKNRAHLSLASLEKGVAEVVVNSEWNKSRCDHEALYIFKFVRRNVVTKMTQECQQNSSEF